MDTETDFAIKAISAVLDTIADAFEGRTGLRLTGPEVATLIRESFQEEQIRDAVARHREMNA